MGLEVLEESVTDHNDAEDTVEDCDCVVRGWIGSPCRNTDGTDGDGAGKRRHPSP